MQGNAWRILSVSESWDLGGQPMEGLAASCCRDAAHTEKVIGRKVRNAVQ